MGEMVTPQGSRRRGMRGQGVGFTYPGMENHLGWSRLSLAE